MKTLSVNTTITTSADNTLKTLSKALGRKKWLAAAMPLIMAAQAQGLEFYAGGIEGSFDSSFSMGSSWRVENADTTLLSGNNGNDGNANYNKGDAFSQVFKGSHDLQFTYQNFGAFVRGKYWYDSALENNQVNTGHGPTASVSVLGDAYGALSGVTASSNTGGKLDDSDFSEYAKFSGAMILDAFVYGEFELGTMPLDVRLGKQVVSWGESTFIQGGINGINPVDVSAFRRPGAEIKEGLIPVNMAYANIGVTDNLSVEAFYQLDFQETVIPGCGTFFSTSDYGAEGCDVVTIGDLGALGNVSVLRNADGLRPAKDEGQFGIAARYILGDTELGFYAMNIHSRLPIVSSVVGGAGITGGGTYFVEYPEDIQLTGISFATNLGSMAVSGEVSHKKDVPLQLNANDFIAAVLSYGTTAEADGGAPAQLNAEIFAATAGSGGNPVGVILDGSRPFDVTQVQVTGIKFFDQVAGASRVTLIGEAGYSFIHDFEEDGEGAIKFGQSGIYEGTTDGFVTESSYGYRARVVANYSDVYAGVNLTPVLSWKHDLEGWASNPGGSFRQGEKSIGLTLKADYLSTYNAAISYTQYMDGDATKVSDRDFASITVGVQF